MMYRRGFLAALLILMLGPVEGCFNSGGSAPSAGTTGSMRVVTGTCKVTFKTETKVHSAGATAQIPMGALLETDAGGTAVVNWGKTSQIVHANTKLTYVAESKIPGYGVSKVDLLRGLTSFFLPKSDTPDFKFQAASHSIVAAVKGTGFDLSAKGDDGPVVVATTHGKVYAFERKPGEPATAEHPEDAGKLLAEVAAGDAYATAATTTEAASAPGAALPNGTAGGGATLANASPGSPASLANASPGGPATQESAAPGGPATPTAPAMRGGVLAQFNKPLATGANPGVIPADSITIWGLTVSALTERPISTF